MSFNAWLLAVARRLLPRAFRDRFGSDLAELTTELANDARARGGPTNEAAYVVRGMTGMTRLAFRLRRHHRGQRGAGAGRRGTLMWEAMLDDLRGAARLARRRPMFGFTMIATLAVAIGAVTTAFGLAGRAVATAALS